MKKVFEGNSLEVPSKYVVKVVTKHAEKGNFLFTESFYGDTCNDLSGVTLYVSTGIPVTAITTGSAGSAGKEVDIFMEEDVKRIRIDSVYDVYDKVTGRWQREKVRNKAAVIEKIKTLDVKYVSYLDDVYDWIYDITI